jgi:hypothetical protein
LENRIGKGSVYKLIKQAVIPFAGSIAALFYGMKYGEQMRKAIWRMANA